MLNSKQRSNLRSLAQKIQVIGQVGKAGISPAQVESFSDALEKRELIKLKVLENAEYTAFEVGEILAKELSAEFVAATGRTVVLYRKSQRDINHLEF